jgi:signal transduction histidine kinase
MARILADERVDHFETVRLTKHGRSLAVSVTISPLKDGGGRIIGASKIVRDISARRRAERRTELLAETASRLLSSDDPQRVVDELCGKVLEFLDSQVFFNFLVDDKQQRLRLNACAGIAQPEAGKIEWLDHCAALCGCAPRDGCRLVAGSIQETNDPRTAFVKPFGIQAYACHPLMVAGLFLGTLSFGTRTRKEFTGEEVSFMKAVTDLVVTAIERKRAQAALQQTTEEVKRSNRDLEQFAYIASHDLQEPLRAVGGYVKLLQRRFPQNMDPKALEYINGAAEGADRMERLISDLLAFSRVGTRGGNFSPAALSPILNQALHNLQTSIESTRAKVTCDPLPTLAVDATQIMQIFQNLIGNAIKFRSGRPPEIHVGAQKQEDRWVFSVRDNGIGIEPQYFERIFQIFQRLHTRRHYPGTGIGLAICKKMVERHQGDIWVESEPGRGSTFFFSIPETSAIKPHNL